MIYRILKEKAGIFFSTRERWLGKCVLTKGRRECSNGPATEVWKRAASLEDAMPFKEGPAADREKAGGGRIPDYLPAEHAAQRAIWDGMWQRTGREGRGIGLCLITWTTLCRFRLGQDQPPGA